MSNAIFSRARWLSAFSVVLLAACGSGQTDPKTSGATDGTATTESTAKTDSTATTAANTAATPEKKAEVAGGTPARSGSGSNEVAGGEPYRLTLFEIARPPFAYSLKTAVKVDAGPAPTLTKASEKKNKITDDVEWFEKNGLTLAGRMPTKTPSTPEAQFPGLEMSGSEKLHYALDHGDHFILMYGANFSAMTTLLLLDKGKVARGQFNFATFVKPPEVAKGEERFTNMEVIWAQKVDDILYVSTAHHTYAKSSNGKNAFITAIGVKDGEIRWQSDPLVCNTQNFVIHGSHIICGYGFSKEDDFLYVISRADGKTVSKTKLAAGPTYLIMKGNQLYVRGYDTDYVFDVK
jgi:hypothetical protein